MIFSYMKSESSNNQHYLEVDLLESYTIISELAKEHYAFNSALYIYDVILTEKVVCNGENYEILVENFIKEGFSKLKEIVKKAIEKIKEFFSKVFNYVTNIIRRGASDKVKKVTDKKKTVSVTTYFYDFEKGFEFFNFISTKLFILIDNRISVLKNIHRNLEDYSAEVINAFIPEILVDQFILEQIGEYDSYEELREELIKKMLGGKKEKTTVEMSIDKIDGMIDETTIYIDSLKETEKEVVSVYKDFLKGLVSENLTGGGEDVKKAYFKFVNFLNTLIQKCSNLLMLLINVLLKCVTEFTVDVSNSVKN